MTPEQQLREVENREAKGQVDLDRAAAARALLDNSLLKEAFGAVEGALVSRLRAIDAGSDEVPDLHRSLKLLGKVQSAIEKHVKHGKLAEADLPRLKEAKRRLKFRLVR